MRKKQHHPFEQVFDDGGRFLTDAKVQLGDQVVCSDGGNGGGSAWCHVDGVVLKCQVSGSRWVSGVHVSVCQV